MEQTDIWDTDKLIPEEGKHHQETKQQHRLCKVKSSSILSSCALSINNSVEAKAKTWFNIKRREFFFTK